MENIFFLRHVPSSTEGKGDVWDKMSTVQVWHARVAFNLY